MTEKKKQKTDRQTERRQTDRDETELIGPIPPVGVGPKTTTETDFPKKGILSPPPLVL